MTVQELIDVLNAVENKNLELAQYCGNRCMKKLSGIEVNVDNYMTHYGETRSAAVLIGID